ncbi:TPA: TonB-dependent siderophore receptor [Neisseria meningitidis]
MTRFKYSLLFAALLPVYAQADVSVSDDPKPQESTELPTITVTADRTASSNDGYTVSGTHTPLGLPMTLREIPQSVSVITSQQMRDQNIKTLDRALLQATGTSRQIYGSDRAGYNYLFARGSRIANYQINGIPVADALADTGNANTAAYERVEVVRGVAGLLDGTGEPSATVNLVRKRLTRKPLFEVRAEAGNRKHFGLDADVSGSLNTEGTLRGRLVSTFGRGDSWRRRERSRDAELYGILEYDIAPQTRVHAGMDYQQAKETADAPLSYAVYDSQGYATAFGPKDNPATNWANSRHRALNLFAGIEHRFNQDWKLKAEYDYTRSRFRQPYGVAGVLSIDHNTAATDLIPGYWHADPRTHSASVSLIGKYRLFGREHDLIAGINGYKYASNKYGERSIIPNAIPNAYEFSRTGAYPQPASFAQTIPQYGTRRQIGGYLATRFRAADNLSLILGGRYTRYRTGSYDSRTQGMTYVSANRFTPYTGIVFDLTGNLSLYGSYSSLFVPQSQKDEHGSYLKPVTGNNLEAGIKGEWLEGRLNASAAVYRARKNNLATAAGRDPSGNTYYRAANQAKTHGWEIEVGGRITPEWQIQAGYSQSKTRDQDGSRQKAYAVADIMARYRFNPRAELSLNVDNLFNKHYRTQPDRHSYGALRTVNAAFTYRFK